MNHYAVIDRYVPLVDVSFKQRFELMSLFCRRYVVEHKEPSKRLLSEKINSANKMILCKDLETAQLIASLIVQNHNTTPDFIQPGVVLFASPIILELGGNFTTNKSLKSSDLENFPIFGDIPLHGGLHFVNAHPDNRTIEIALIEQIPDNFVFKGKAFYIHTSNGGWVEKRI